MYIKNLEDKDKSDRGLEKLTTNLSFECQITYIKNLEDKVTKALRILQPTIVSCDKRKLDNKSLFTNEKPLTMRSNLFVLTCVLVTMATVALATPVQRITYDQRQDGDYNFATHIKKVVLLVPSDAKSEVDFGELDFEDLKALNQQAQLNQHLGQLSQQATRLNQQQAASNMKLIASRNQVK